MDSMPGKRCMGFSPTLRGCVAPNAQMARAMGEVARLALSGVIANTYRSLIFEEEKALSEHFDALAIEWLSYFRLVGRLMIALGGDPVRCGVLRANGRRGVRERERNALELRCGEVAEAVRELHLWRDRLQALIARNGDRVVCAVLETLADDAERLATETERLLR